MSVGLLLGAGFQHTAARRRLGRFTSHQKKASLFQHTAARRRLVTEPFWPVSLWSFNTQPPEGGWVFINTVGFSLSGFNTQPPEGGWVQLTRTPQVTQEPVSTHSRPKAAGPVFGSVIMCPKFQHTAARRRLGFRARCKRGEFELQHTAARRRLEMARLRLEEAQAFQHTAARRRLV